MGYVCAWCRDPGATRKVVCDGDGSEEHYRYFCNNQHQANWETNQPRKVPAGIALEAASIWEIIKHANLDCWFLVSMGQYGTREDIKYRATFQRRTLTGATLETFTAFADADDPRSAVLGAYRDTRKAKPLDAAGVLVRSRKIEDNSTRDQNELTPRQEAALTKALDANWYALVTNGARSRN